MKRSEIKAFFLNFKEKAKLWIQAKPYYACSASFLLGMISVLLWDLVVAIVFLLVVIAVVAWFLAEPDIPAGPSVI